MGHDAEKHMMFLRATVKSIRHAWRGLRLCFKTERSFRIQTAIFLGLIVVTVLLPLTTGERFILLSVAMFVLVLELLNSALERLVDLIKPRLDPYAGDAKDLMAGAVLLASGFALVIGVVILLPHLFYLYRHL